MDPVNGPHPTTIDALVETYEVLLLDAYGVLITHDTVLPGAVELINRLNRSSHPYFIVTNDASRSPRTSATRYAKRGLSIDPCRIITSGLLLKPYFRKHNLRGAGCIVLGPEDSLQYVVEAGGTITDPFADQEPDAVVIADEHGYPFMETVDRTLTLLYRKLDRGGPVKLLLPNPDLVYPAGPDTYGFTSGALARMFEAALRLRYPQRPDLAFVPLGKPHGPIFEEALRRSNTRSMVMVGDQLDTDIKGAVDFGLDAALVGTGLSQPITPDGTQVCQPTYYLESLEVTGQPSSSRISGS